MARTRLFAASVAFCVVTALAVAAPSPWLALRPGPVIDTSDVVDTEPPGRFVILTVTAQPLRWLESVVTQLSGVEVWREPANVQSYLERARLDTVQSVNNAREVAERITRQPAPDVNVDRFVGPSAGLALTLALLDAESDGDLSGGQLVAASATVHRDGQVGPVDALETKGHAATTAGVHVLFVHPDNRGALNGFPFTVVEVTSVDEAVDWLCINSDDSICSRR